MSLRGVFYCLLVLACFSQTTSLECGDGKIRGVNLGGWLLLEPWITPVLFEEVNVDANNGLVVDEWTYAQYVDPTFAAERLDRHWNTFYSQEDLQKLFDSGISHLRIPVGYWMVDVQAGEPFPAPPATDADGMRFYLKRLVGWAEEIGLKILLDLHGCPGSQNGFDNSGRRGNVDWFNPDDHSNIDRTLTVLEQLGDIMLAWITEGTMSQSTLYGIELANEPLGWHPEMWAEIRDHFNYDGYDVLRLQFPDTETNAVIIQQCFRASSDFYGYMSEAEGYYGVGLDMHVYHAFGPYWNGMAGRPEGWQANLDAACQYSEEVSGQTLDTFTGEWSLAVTDCQMYIDGGYADPYEPAASESTCAYYNSDFNSYSSDYRIFLGDFAMAQMDGFEVGKGWFFWTAKTEDNCAPEWDYIYLLDQGIMPSNLCDRPNHCSFVQAN